MSVTPLFAVNAYAPTAEDQAKFLTHLAQRVRNGSLVIHRAALVYTDENHRAQVLPFGENTNTAELVGVLDMAKLKVALF